MITYHVSRYHIRNWDRYDYGTEGLFYVALQGFYIRLLFYHLIDLMPVIFLLLISQAETKL